MDQCVSVINQTNCNSIQQVAVSELLDGRLFVIPTYQRGYRWGRRQVVDLCNDLLEYALKENKPKEGFYSLQPLIVVRDNKLPAELETESAEKVATWRERGVYRVIDGQQRLTTIFLLYRFLLKRNRYDSLEEAKENLNKELFHIYYETRPGDFSILEIMGFEKLTGCQIRDIDIAHAFNAMQYMDDWLKGSGPDSARHLCEFLNEEYTQKEVIEKLLNLLNNAKNTKNAEGNVQFLWYELAPGKDEIREFLSENKGKIRLTDAEKIKALFLQRKNFGDDLKNRRQQAMAKDWDNIEMALHEPDFWAILSNDRKKEHGRIEIIFRYIYDLDTHKKDYSDVDDYLFRYFSDKLEELKTTSHNATKAPVDILWGQVVNVYRMLRNWYYNPQIYNLIGLLTKCGVGLTTIAAIYEREDITTSKELIYELNCLVTKSLFWNSGFMSEEGNEELKIQKGERFINLFYSAKDRKLIKNILIFLNVRLLLKQMEKVIEDTSRYNLNKKSSDAARSPRDINSLLYRFPFDILDSMEWDIEHIDSATANSLTAADDQTAFIEEAEKLSEINNHPEYNKLKEAYNSAAENQVDEARSQLVSKIRNILDEDESDVKKNWIGNLTLLDSGTNRSYKNKVYPLKQLKIRDRISNGIFVPVCTTNIFEKRFDGCSNDNIHWSFDDKKAHHDFILREIDAFITTYPLKSDNDDTIQAPYI